MALSDWAVNCDALARGEQIFLLQPAPAEAGSEKTRGGDGGLLPDHEEFWLWPLWEGQVGSDLTEPYRDRMRALSELRHEDRRPRIQYYVTLEYAERISSARRLLALDGEHTLNSGAVERRFRVRDDGSVWFLLLRVYEKPEAVVLRPASGQAPSEPGARLSGPRAPAWRELPRPIPTGGLEPVLSGRRFLREKARILQRTGSVRAV